jgi:hypothetical protein
MARGTVGVVAVAALVALAGCNGWVDELALVAPPSQSPGVSSSQVRSVAISGEWAAVGRIGKVDLFHRNDAGSWDFATALLPASDEGTFGYAVAMDGDTLVVGAPVFSADPSIPGYADVFVRAASGGGQGQWSRQQTLTPSGLASAFEFAFGAAVDIQGDTAVVGADRFNDGDGRAFVFDRRGAAWTQSQVLQPAIDVEDADFGAIVRISGDTIAVAAPGPGLNHVRNGEVDLFDRVGQTWSPTQALKASGPGGASAPDGFGGALSISGDTLVAFAPGGLATFRRRGGTWSVGAALPGISGAVAVTGPYLFAGDASRAVGGEANAGAVDVYRSQGGAWQKTATLSDPSPKADETFGGAIDAAGFFVVVGSFAATDGGVARVYHLE